MRRSVSASPSEKGPYLSSSCSADQLGAGGGQYSQVETKYQVGDTDKHQQQQQQQYLGQLAAAASGSMMCRAVH